MFANANGPDYTQWWVDGPLSNGSPVQILQGWSSVTGSESVNLGGSLGTRNAWIVTSQLSQTINLNIPNVSNPLGQPTTSTVHLDLGLVWNFDKSADLLLRNNDTLNLTMHSVSATLLTPFQPCTGPSCTLTNYVNVIRDTTVKLNLTMLLSSTSLKLSGPGSPATPQAPNLMQSIASLPWFPLGVAGIAAGGIAGLAVFLARKANRNIPHLVQARSGQASNPPP